MSKPSVIGEPWGLVVIIVAIVLGVTAYNVADRWAAVEVARAGKACP